MTTTAPEPTTKRARTKALKLDLGCGQNPQKGFTGVDIWEEADVVCNLFQFPWPFEDNSIKEVWCSHLVEHIPHWRPEYGNKDGWFWFFDEIHRICRKNAKVTITHPYAKNNRAFQDPTHTRYIPEETWAYLDQDWLKATGLNHYPYEGDFEVVVMSGTGMDANIAGRNDEYQALARGWYWNILPDLVVELKVRK